MSGRRAKRERAQRRAAGIIDTPTTYPNDLIPKSDVLSYIFSLFKRYSGYTCITIGPPNEYGFADITAHHAVPTITNGKYQSDKDCHITRVKIPDPKFKGVVCDRAGNAMIGDPWSTAEDEQ